jgi:hypothetical protein
MSAPSHALPPLVLESRDVTVTLIDRADLDRFVIEANVRGRIKGLDDAVNPDIIDAGKLRAMVAALPMQTDDVRAALAGHKLIVNNSGFGVLAVEPTRADAFGPSYRITIERMAGIHVLAHANPAMDKDLARSRAAAARAATESAVAAVKSIEGGRPDPDGGDLGGVRWRRARAARGWVIAAGAWQEADPTDAAALSSLEEAKRAVRSFDMPSGGLVRRP